MKLRTGDLPKASRLNVKAYFLKSGICKENSVQAVQNKKVVSSNLLLV